MPKILLADDDRAVLHLLSAQFRARGWEVTLAQDAMQVVMMAIRSQPDAVLLDLQMPGGTGLAALRQLKSSVKTAGIPVVVLTASADPELLARAREAGAQAVLTKPADASAVLEALGGAS
jgi:CheY-like chemotaxis protein